MGLKVREHLVTAGLLTIAVAAALLAPPGAPRQRADDRRTWLPFHGAGAQGPIDGVVIVEEGRIVDVEVTRSQEGVDRRALDADRIGARFRGRPAAPPLGVDAISGATISSRHLIEAVERRLARWRERARE